MNKKPEDCFILIVDDDSMLRDVIATQLELKKFNVIQASGGNEALQIVKSQKVHLVVSDICMPNGDGVSLLEQIRSYDPNIPHVILMSGYSSVSEKSCLEKGAYRLISKPFSGKDLISTVMKALEIAPAISKLAS